jgi:peptide-methionine (S)-S-oxide reductase
MKIKTILFGGGCFWCTEAIFQRLRGVKSVEPGYSGGNTDNPTYEQVSSGTTGYVEVARVDYDPSEIELEDLLAVFFSSHDPTQPDGQGKDIGEQYRSVIFYNDEEQKRAAEAYIAKLEQEGVYDGNIVTTLEPQRDYYPAERYHHDYYNQNQNQPYCRLVINPKLEKLKKQYQHLLKDEV